MSDLFPITESLSPRLRWLKEHNLSLGELPNGQRFCVGLHGAGFGETHRDAELDYCEVSSELVAKIQHWSVTEFQKAGVVIPTEVEEEMG